MKISKDFPYFHVIAKVGGTMDGRWLVGGGRGWMSKERWAGGGWGVGAGEGMGRGRKN